MPTRASLTGIGMPAEHARALGYTFPATSITAAGTTSANATAALAAQNFILMTATGVDGIRLPTLPYQMTPTIVVNVSAAAGLVYPPTGGNFAGGSADAGISVPARKTIIIMRYSALGYSYNLSA